MKIKTKVRKSSIDTFFDPSGTGQHSEKIKQIISRRNAISFSVLPELVPKNEVRFFELRNFVLFPFFSAKKSVFPLFWGKMSVFPLFWSSSVFFDKKFLATLKLKQRRVLRSEKAVFKENETNLFQMINKM